MFGLSAATTIATKGDHKKWVATCWSSRTVAPKSKQQKGSESLAAIVEREREAETKQRQRERALSLAKARESNKAP